MWSEEHQRWFDYSLITNTSVTDITTIASYIPLWAGLGPTDATEQTALLNSFISSGLHQVGGILTTNLSTTQQWDSPNAWPPLVWLTIQGLLALKVPQAVQLAVS